MDNKITLLMKKLIKKDYMDCLSGTLSYSTNGCQLQERGGVYGFAIKLSNRGDKENFFNAYNEKTKGKNKVELKDWIPFATDFYPLYWGKDINLGFRLFDHTKSRKSTATLQLDNREYLKGKEVIYGAILCKNIADNEKKLRKNYPDIFKNKTT